MQENPKSAPSIFNFPAWIAHYLTKPMKELLPEMKEAQYNNIKKATEYTRRINEAQALAERQERLYWILGLYGVGGSILLYELIKTHKIPFTMFASATVSVTAFVFQLDYVFANKSNRINSMFNKIATDDTNWFVPIDTSTKQDNNPNNNNPKN